MGFMRQGQKPGKQLKGEKHGNPVKFLVIVPTAQRLVIIIRSYRTEKIFIELAMSWERMHEES